MSRAKIVTDNEGRFYGVRFNCPGCALLQHQNGGTVTLPVNWTPPNMERSPLQGGRPHWTFNGDLERPTFGPSINSRWKRWAGHDQPSIECVCHSFIRDGRIQFLNDCTHALAGQTVDLPEIEDEAA
ncbi:MAG: DUF6527 family protein [Mizugakiibacter sp.]|uniref:DUF6527 family protein n=1 Tax=Mizugakiibacter sp. TaxID=1972610 RepID=UPI00320CBEEE